MYTVRDYFSNKTLYTVGTYAEAIRIASVVESSVVVNHDGVAMYWNVDIPFD